MSPDEYVPAEEDFIDSWACAHVTPHDMTSEEARDAARAFLTRVRCDAYDEGYQDAQDDEREHRPWRKSVHPYRQEQTIE